MRLCLSLALLCACPSGQAHSPPPEVHTVAFTPGQLHTYALEWTAEAASERSHAVPDGIPVGGGLHLRGQLAIQAADDGTLTLWFTELTERELLVLGERLAIDPTQVLGHRVHVEQDLAGGFTRAWFDPDSPSLFRHIMGGLLARLDLRAATTGAQVVPTAHGLARAVYHHDAGILRRDITDVIRLDTLPPGTVDVPQLHGSTQRGFDERGALLTLVADEQLAATQDGLAFASQDHFSLHHQSTHTADPIPAPDRTTLIALDPGAPPDPREADQAIAQRFAEGTVVADIGAGVQDIDNGLLPHPGFTTRAVGLLRGWPERTPEVAALALAATSMHGRRLVFDLLAAAGTSESQASMRELLERPAAADWHELPSLVQRFALIQRPTSATGWWLLDLHDQSGGELRRALHYPLGSLCARLQADDPWLAALLHERLLSELEAHPTGPDLVAVLAGLGNARQAIDADNILPFVGDPDFEVRLISVTALRGIVDESTTAALFTRLHDPEPQVAAQALAILHRHHLGPEGSPRLAALVDTDLPPALWRPLADALTDRIDDGPSVRPALLRLADLADTTLRDRIPGALVRLAE